MLEVKIKKICDNAIIPVKNHSNDACWDLFSVDDGVVSDDGNFIQYKTGISIEIPAGYDAYVYPRSSVSKYNLVLANSVGVIDESYRGEIIVRFKIIKSVHGHEQSDYKIYKKGDRIAQIHLQKRIEFVFVESESLSNTARSDGGFGSTGS